MNTVTMLLLARSPHKFQHPMDGAGFIAGRLRHALRRPAGRSRQLDLQPLHLKIAENCVDRGCLTSARTSRDHRNSPADRLRNRFSLSDIQLQLLLRLDPAQPVLHLLRVHRISHIQIRQHLRRVQLHIVIRRRINDRLPVPLLHDQSLIQHQIHDVLLHRFLRYTQ